MSPPAVFLMDAWAKQHSMMENLTVRSELSILIVEDDQTSRTLLIAMLERSGLAISKIESAEDLKTACDLLENDHFDVTLLDLNLPDSSGLDTLVSLRKKQSAIAIVIITGEYEEQTGLEAIAKEAQEYIIKGRFDIKTLNKSILYAIVRRVVDCELQSTNEKYRTVFESSAVAITVADEHGRLTSWNKCAENLLGMTEDDLHLRPVKTLYPVEEWEILRESHIRQRRIQNNLETRMARKDGGIVDVEISLSVFKDLNGRTTGSIAIITDISERKRIHEILDRKQKSLEAIFDAAPVGMLLLNENLAVKRVNRTFKQMVRKEYPQIVGQSFGGALSCVNSTKGETGCGGDSACVKCILAEGLKRVLGGGRPLREVEVKLTYRLEDKNVTSWFSTNAEPLMLDGSKHIVVAIADVTSRRKAEEDLKETMEMKSQFIATVSHELRTPLGCMSEAVSIVLDGIAGKINSKQKDFLSMTKRNIVRLTELINEVLDVQKLEAGSMGLDVQEVDMGELVEEVYKMATASAKKKGVGFTLESAGGPRIASLDRVKMIQVLMNLVSNAIKFTPEGGSITVGAQRQGDEIVLRVSDTGMGIPKDALPRVFDRFYRVQRPGEQIQGTGLGLCIVNSIVILHGGRIEIESEVGEGTTFSVFLPITPRPAAEVCSDQSDMVLENAVASD